MITKPGILPNKSEEYQDVHGTYKTKIIQAENVILMMKRSFSVGQFHSHLMHEAISLK